MDTEFRVEIRGKMDGVAYADGEWGGWPRVTVLNPECVDAKIVMHLLGCMLAQSFTGAVKAGMMPGDELHDAIDWGAAQLEEAAHEHAFRMLRRSKLVNQVGS